ncbi:MAG: hypothetical protein OEM38_08960 [Gammaproteobacteria bacterium]|nr:hypothetical protein [Gammaproteobacteria bacterium]
MSRFSSVYLKVFLLSVLLLSQGCTILRMIEHDGMKNPELVFIDYKIIDVGMKEVKIDFNFTADNPNEYNIETFYVDYQFFIKEQPVARGYSIKMDLIPEGVSQVTIPMALSYENFYETVGTLAGLIQQDKTSVDARVDIIIYGEYFIAEAFNKTFTKFYSYQHSLNMEIPLPEVSVESVSEMVTDKLNSFFGD